jgi:hypothetical protein
MGGGAAGLKRSFNMLQPTGMLKKAEGYEHTWGQRGLGRIR